MAVIKSVVRPYCNISHPLRTNVLLSPTNNLLNKVDISARNWKAAVIEHIENAGAVLTVDCDLFPIFSSPLVVF